jgi:hypothetical protein
MERNERYLTPRTELEPANRRMMMPPAIHDPHVTMPPVRGRPVDPEPGVADCPIPRLNAPKHAWYGFRSGPYDALLARYSIALNKRANFIGKARKERVLFESVNGVRNG